LEEYVNQVTIQNQVQRLKILNQTGHTSIAVMIMEIISMIAAAQPNKTVL
jgi:hypothetical protein